MAIKRITTNLIKDSDIATVDIANNAITAAKITDGNITTAKLADLSVTAGKLAGTLDLTGKTITVATATTGDNDTSPASTAFVQQEIAALVDSSPSSLNTLNELAAALGDDASFSTTVTNSIALKAPLASPALTGTVTAASHVQIAGNLDVVGQIGAYNNPGSAWGAMGFRATDYTFKNSGGTIKVAIDSSGNVGIGGAPDSSGRLLVQNGGTNQIVLTNNDSATTNLNMGNFSGGGYISQNYYYDSGHQADDNTKGAFEIFIGDDAYGINYHSAGAYGTRRRDFAIDSSGNVGIGTSSPTTPLTLNGTDPLITFENGESPHWQIGFENTQSDRFVLYDNNAASYRVIVDSSGNVGIGTSSITNNTLGKTTYFGNSTSSITGDSSQARFWLGNNWYYNSGDKFIGTGYSNLYTQQSGTHQFLTSTASGTAGATVTFKNVMTIDSSGKVGIGTDTPGARLHVVTSGADGIALDQDTGSTNNSSRLFFNSTSGNWAVFNNSGMLNFQSGAAAGSTSGNYTDLQLTTSQVICRRPFTVSANNLNISSGYGINFSANANAAGMSSEVLDDYEEGTFTPSCTNLGTTVFSAKYTKVGDLVTLVVYLETTTANSGTSGPATFTGLPFTSQGNGWSVGALSIAASNPVNGTPLHVRVVANSSSIDLKKNNDTTMIGSDVDAGHIIWTVSYKAA
jgi:hypothetical protein